MTKKKAVAFAVFLVFAAAGYIYFYGGVFSKKSITIMYTRSRANVMRRPNPNAQNAPPPPVSVTFALDTEYRLTAVKVIPLAEYQKNKYSSPIWDMTSDSNSPPTKAFAYGENIKGMHPVVKGAKPEPLSNDIPYKLLVKAGKILGELEFTVPGANATSPTNH